jgi:hypothetical protein
MSINNLNTYLNIKDSHLRVVSGNVYAQAMNIGGINVETAHGLQSVSNTGNVTSNTIQFSNAITGFVTTANAQIGRDLVVSGNTTVSTDLTVSANATVADTLTISEHVIASKEATVTGNLHVTTIRSDSNVVTEYTGPHDRSLRKYPEVAMTANDNSSTSGYVADQTAYSGNADGYAYRLFDHSLSSAYQSANTQYSGGISTSSAQTTTATDGSTHQGVAITLDLATKIRLSYAKITSHTFYGRTPADGSFLGSNDNTTWDLIGTFSGLSTSAVGQTHTVHIADYTTKAVYRYMRLVVTRTSDSLNLLNGGTLLEFKELEYYGHEEGSGSLDTTLKTVYNVPATTGTQLEVYYDAKNLADGALSTTSGAIPGLGGTTVNGTAYGDPQVSNEAFVFDGNDYISTTVTGLTGTSVTMSVWVNVNSIDTSRINSIIGLGTYDTGTAGSSTWIAIDSSQRFYTGLVGLDQTVENTSAFTNNWVHLTAIVGTTELSLYQDGLLIGKVNGGTFNLGSNPVLYLGTRSDGSGNPESTRHFTGSIANFRLYSKALNADQIKELYDYQKDYFLGSKSQVTLYKGHLGVGVTEPSGQLELAGDERIQEYPPGPMSNYETLIPGHGVFCASMSNPNTGGKDAWKAFNKVTGNTDHIEHAYTPSYQYGANDGNTLNSFANPTNIPYNTNGVVGLWIQLELPYEINLKRYSLTARSTSTLQASRMPEQGVLFGSNDGVTWTAIHNHNDTAGRYTSGIGPRYFSVDDTYTYRYFRLVTTKLFQLGSTSGNERPDISELKFFGTPGPTTLDKGSLTLGRSLDVPRVSRYDVDTETPRPEKLVVDFDTTVNSSPTDISGQGNHGRFVGATYSAPDKAFSFNGNQYIQGDTGLTGNFAHSISMWFKASNDGQLFWTGINSSSQVGYRLNIFFSEDGGLGGNTTTPQIHYTFKNHTHYANVNLDQWHHLVCTYSGTDSSNRKIYIDGLPAGSDTATDGTGQTTHALNIQTSTFYLNKTNYSNGTLVGSIANFKLYSVALEPSEVRKLYNLGRTGRSMVISDTAVGIGKVPEAQLDVRGNLRVGGTIQVPLIITHRYITADTTVTGSNYIPFSGIIYENPTGLYNGNYFVCPIKGIYECVANLLTDNGGSYDGNHTWLLNGSETSPSTRGFATAANGNRHKTGTSHYYLELNSGDAIGLGGVSTIVWYGSPSHRHSHMSIRLITPT